MVERRITQWYCVSCNHVLGEVIGGEFKGASDISGDAIQTRGPNLVVTCPKCESTKVWYTSDPITRAVHQLVDSVVTVSANRMVRVVGLRLHEMGGTKDFDDN